jgi:hypothetical protein
MSILDSLAKAVFKLNPGQFLIFAGLTFIFVAQWPKTELQQWIVLAGLVMAFLGAAMVMFLYLQQVRRRPGFERTELSQLTQLQTDVAKLRAQTAGVASFSPKERQGIIDNVTANLTHETAAKIASIWAEKFDQKSIDERHKSVFLETANNLIERLQDEISALGRRANVNLVIGILVSALGLIVLTWFVISATNELSSGMHPEDAAIRFVIRISLAIFIQVFAYFFLRLYRYSIFEIKYFQNEITGAQFKLLALVSGLDTKDKSTIQKLCLELAKTERNFILKKGETTAALQRDEIERDYENRMFAMVEKIVGTEKKASK